MQGRPVFLVSDQPDRARRLARGVCVIMPCRVVEALAELPAQPPVAWIIDLELESIAETGWFDRLCARIDPDDSACILLARDIGARDSTALARLGAAVVVPSKTKAESIVSTLVRAIDQIRLRDTHGEREHRLVHAVGIVGNLFTSAAMHRAPSLGEVEEGTRIVLDTVSEIGIRDWLDMIWRHDATVYQHSLSVAGCAAAFATELGFSRADKHLLAKAALLHDVGKSRIPLTILNKPGPLTPGEMAIMQTHAAIGGELLAATGDYDPAIIAVARHHHERLDGSGYPDGLVGGAIDDLSRLVAICDVHSAMTERRVYRLPMSGAEARAVMNGMAGQLDADLLRAYQPILDLCEHARATV